MGVSQVVGTFGNGRVETFIPYRPLTEDEMAQPKLSADIARRLAQLHAVNVEGQDEGEVFGLTRQWCTSRLCPLPFTPLRLHSTWHRQGCDGFDKVTQEGLKTCSDR